MNRLMIIPSLVARRYAVVLPQLTAFSGQQRLYSSTAVERTGEADETLRARLLYQSRKRGILENDIILGEFAERSLGSMDRKQLLEYDNLINGEHMEWDLFYFLSGRKEPPKEMENSTIFQQMRDYVKSKEQASTKK
ncbi:unnamed protein product [Anisakis simplex]|uniref:Succinate dehydrogenase assembly factor 2, mitochondrial n=1 Tax=Anisakis simplex TaxID=6269 RepID=A0A0M3KE43_ANISI|nr:unnamed protein product [Anisakis simplex]